LKFFISEYFFEFFGVEGERDGELIFEKVKNIFYLSQAKNEKKVRDNPQNPESSIQESLKKAKKTKGFFLYTK